MVLSLYREESAREDTLTWTIEDYLGKIVRSGTVKVSSGQQTLKESLKLEGLPAGYMEVRVKLGDSAVVLPGKGSRPAGMASFGVTSRLTLMPLAHPDESRFGIQGTNFIQSGVFMQGNPYDPLYKSLGVRWVNAGRNWADAEPERAGQFAESLKNRKPSESDYVPKDNLAPLNCVAYLPWWALKVPPEFKLDQKNVHLKQSFPPKDLGQYSAYLTQLGADLKNQRETIYPAMKSVYYQVGWEPDWHWKGTDEEFVSLYTAAYKAIHAGDPDAIVLGPGYGVTATGVKLLEKLLPLGLDKALDGIAIHGYYVPFGNPLATTTEGKYVSPEEGEVIPTLRKLRSLMAKYFKPEAKLFQTEWGLDYRGRYSTVTPELLRRQAAYIIRGHIIFLGEGCDVTYFFYTADYGTLDKPGEDGYGLCFNLTMPTPSFGAIRVSPKPVFMGASTLTRVLEGSKTLGPVTLGESEVYAYAFDRAGQTVVALWSGDNKERTVRVPVSEGARLLDFMGNEQKPSSADGVFEVTSSMYPVYVLGADLGKLTKIQENAND